jgi:type I restriction enzyme S subunit
MSISKEKDSKPLLRFAEFSENWNSLLLKDLFTRSTVKNSHNISDVLTNSAVKGIVSQGDYFDRDIANQNNLLGYYVVDVNNFVYNPRISKSAPVGPLKRNKLFKGVMSPLYTVLKPKKGDLNFLEAYFESNKWHTYMRAIANYGVRHDRMNITIKDFEKLPIFLPCLSEQKKISTFIGLFTDKKEVLNEKLIFLEKYKKGIIQKIFKEEIKFKDVSGVIFPEWIDLFIGDLFSNRSEKTSEKMELLSVTIGRGVIRQSNLSKDDNSSDDKSNYKRVYKNDIAYNSMRMWQGALGVSDYNGIVSPAYTILKPNSNCYPKFFEYYFKTIPMLRKFQRNSQGLTSDTWNLKYPQLSKIKISIPVIEEQIKIANFLSTIDVKIEVIKKELNYTEFCKKGLLQQMFV